MYRDTIFQYVKKQYGTIPEYLWNDLPDSAILRNDNGKWYAVFMNLEGFKIGLDTKDRVDIMVVKCKPDMISVMTHMKGFLPGYYCYPAPLVLQIILISVKLNEGTDSDILMFFTAECLNRYLLVLSYQSYKNSRYLPDQSLTPAIITIRCTTTSLDREMLHQRYDNNYSTF